MSDKRKKVVLLALTLSGLQNILGKLDYSKVMLVAMVSDCKEDIDVRVNEIRIPFYDYSDLDRVLQETNDGDTYYLLCGYRTHLREFGVVRKMLKVLGNVKNDYIVNASLFFETAFVSAYRYAMQGNLDFFATGISYMMVGLSVTDLPLGCGANLAASSQDIYYGKEIAKRVLRANSGIKYAFIGLSPYSFSYCLSQSFSTASMSIPYELLWDTKRYCNEMNQFMKSSLFTDLFTDVELYDPAGPNYLQDVVLNLNNMLDIDRELSDIVPSGNKLNVAKNKNWLKEYIDLCVKQDCIPIGVVLPMSPLIQKSYPYEALNEYRSILEDFSLLYNFLYIDLWDVELPMNCFYDLVHLNKLGAKQITKIIYEKMKEIGLDKKADK